MRELIIHADDYGLTGSVSLGIIHTHAHGVVTSTSILMTHLTPKEATWLASEVTLDCGLHLNLTAGSPVSPLSDIPALVGDRRIFTIPRVVDPDSPHKRFDFTDLPEAELRRELSAQVQAGRELATPLSHLDTHHHIHRDPRIFELVLELALAEGLALRALDDDQRARCHAAGVATTGLFLGDWFGNDAITAEALLASIETLPAACVAEVMCHPGQASETLAVISSYNAQRQVEMEVLTAPTLREALREREVRLIGWGDL